MQAASELVIPTVFQLTYTRTHPLFPQRHPPWADGELILDELAVFRISPGNVALTHLEDIFVACFSERCQSSFEIDSPPFAKHSSNRLSNPSQSLSAVD
jgi:hypothetical protein